MFCLPNGIFFFFYPGYSLARFENWRGVCIGLDWCNICWVRYAFDWESILAVIFSSLCGDVAARDGSWMFFSSNRRQTQVPAGFIGKRGMVVTSLSLIFIYFIFGSTLYGSCEFINSLFLLNLWTSNDLAQQIRITKTCLWSFTRQASIYIVSLPGIGLQFRNLAANNLFYPESNNYEYFNNLYRLEPNTFLHILLLSSSLLWFKWE